MSHGEIRSLAWANVSGDVIELEARDAKNGCARKIPIVGADLAGILARRKEAKVVKPTRRRIRLGERTTMAALIFHRNGRPIVDI
jgi:hypothetical protein